MALSPTRARIAAEPLPGSAVTAFCAVDIWTLLIVGAGMKNAPPVWSRRGVVVREERGGSAAAQESRYLQQPRIVVAGVATRRGQDLFPLYGHVMVTRAGVAGGRVGRFR